jgi:DNA-directed RNA polymerase specialized sigma24 family protein
VPALGRPRSRLRFPRGRSDDALQHTFMAAYRALRSSERPILKAWL